MASYAALLRAVNVAGRNLIKMVELRTLCGELGLEGVETLVQSGNIVFSTKEPRARVAARLGDGIEERFGFRPEIMLRSAAELRRAFESDIVSREPFARAREAEPNRLLVMFLGSAPAKGAEDALRDWHKGPESFALDGQELYLYYPSGAGKTKLVNTVIERKLGVVGTARNWNSVRKLLEMAESR